MKVAEKDNGSFDIELQGHWELHDQGCNWGANLGGTYSGDKNGNTSCGWESKVSLGYEF